MVGIVEGVLAPEPLIDPVDASHENVPYLLLSNDRDPAAFSCHPFREKLYWPDFNPVTK
jgi:hypothetical protein